MPDSWGDDDYFSKYNNQMDTIEERLMDLLNQKAAKEPRDAETLSQALGKEISASEKRLKTLQDQKAVVDSDCYFLFDLEQIMTEYEEWCFENDITYLVKEVKILGDHYQLLTFKSAEDAAGFKLTWL